MAKVGRNAPCPCGSGKKYKMCCLAQDEAASRTAAAAAAEASPAPARKRGAAYQPPLLLEPHEEAMEARWEQYESLDYEGRIALFNEMLGQPEFMDDDMAFEMLDSLHGATMERGDRDRFDALIAALRDRLPDVYASSAHFYLDWRISNALATGRSDVLAQWVQELAETDEFDIDTFNNVVDRLAYHGHLSLLLDATRRAWPRVNEPGHVVPWGIDEFAEQAIGFVLFDHIDQRADPDPGDPVLIEQIEYYSAYNAAHIERILKLLTGRDERAWTLEDFQLWRGKSPTRRRDDDDAASDAIPGWQQLYFFSVDFLGYAHREEGISLTKGELARHQLYTYILKRVDGQLEPRARRFRDRGRPRRQKRRGKPQPDAPPLCPDHATMDRFLAETMPFINPQWHKTAATFELIPAWLRFLELRGFIDAEQHAQTRQALEPLRDAIGPLLERHMADPSLSQSLRAWVS
jgi:hypothetical protein